jgi:2-phosphosulfolactate phosphatase
MQFRRASLETCADATGTVVVIDVLRAFSTAAYALAAGARSIAVVGTVTEALALRQQLPDALVMGEVDGLPVPSFDLGNSPAAFARLDVAGRRLIQRTSAGTQGLVRSLSAERLYASSLCCAAATARHILCHAPDVVTFVPTGLGPDRDGDEDVACADYLEALLRGEEPEVAPFVQRVYASRAGRIFADPAQPDFPLADLEHCVQVDRFDLALLVRRCDRLLLIEGVHVPFTQPASLSSNRGS